MIQSHHLVTAFDTVQPGNPGLMQQAIDKANGSGLWLQLLQGILQREGPALLQFLLGFVNGTPTA